MLNTWNICSVVLLTAFFKNVNIYRCELNYLSSLCSLE